MNYIEAINLVGGYAKEKKVVWNDVLIIDEMNRFRGYINFTEVEYKFQTLIVRGYIYEGKKERKDVWNSLQEIYLLNINEFKGSKFELDSTYSEIDKKYAYRINLRIDFRDSTIQQQYFNDYVDFLMELSLKWKNEYFLPIVLNLNSNKK